MMRNWGILLVMIGLSLPLSAANSKTVVSSVSEIQSETILVKGTLARAAGRTKVESAASLLGKARRQAQTYQGVSTMAQSSTDLGYTVKTAYPDHANGNTIVRLNQTINRIPIFGGDVAIQVTPENDVVGLSGPLRAKLPEVEALLSQEEAEAKAIASLAKKGAPDKIHQHGLKLYFTSNNPEDPGMYVWHFSVQINRAMTYQEVLVDAETGKIPLSYNDIQSERNLKTYHGRNTNLFSHAYSNLHTEDDLVYHNDTLVNEDLLNLDPDVDPDVINNYHTAIKETYDYFKDTHNRDSFDNEGRLITGIVKTEGFNAFYHGGFHKIVFGGGIRNGRYVSLGDAKDIVAHELGHGVTDYTADLIYYSQSGALNESYSDIWGVMVDRDDWIVGDGVLPLRDFEDPNRIGNLPKHMDDYRDILWDNAGVHINSSIINHLFYRLAQAIGKESAEQIFYRALTVYMVSTTDFNEARVYWVQSAVDLFGEDSEEKDAVIAAAEGVGLKGFDEGTVYSEPTRVENVYSTPHPYQNDMDVTETFTVPGAVGMQVVLKNFDLESGYDEVVILDGSNQVVERFTGTHDNDIYSKVVPGDVIKVQFTSDVSVVEYGFDVDQISYASVETVAFVGDAFTTPHPAEEQETYTRTFAQDGATKMSLLFRRFQTESDVTLHNEEGYLMSTLSGSQSDQTSIQVVGSSIQLRYTPTEPSEFGVEVQGYFFASGNVAHIDTISPGHSSGTHEDGLPEFVLDDHLSVHFDSLALSGDESVSITLLDDAGQRLVEHSTTVESETVAVDYPDDLTLSEGSAYRVAVSLDAEAKDHKELSFYPVALPIAGLTAEADAESITLSWSDPAQGEYGDLDIYQDGTRIRTVLSSVRSLVVDGLERAQAYQFQIKSSRYGLEGVSSLVTIETLGYPDPVSSLQAVASDQAIQLTWGLPTQEIPYDRILVSKDGVLLEPLAPSETILSFTDLTNGQSYRFEVKTAFEDFLSDPATVVASPVDTVAPQPPANLQVTVGDNFMTVTGDYPDDADLVGVDLYLGDDTNPNLRFLPPNTITHTLTELANGESYAFRFQSVDDDGLKSEMITVSGTPVDEVPPSPVTDLAITPSDEQLVITWENPSTDDLEAIRLYVGETLVRTLSPGEATTHTLSGLTNGEDLTISVLTVDDDGLQSSRTTLVGTPVDLTDPDPIQSLAIETGDNTLSVTWANPDTPDLDHVDAYVNGELHETFALDETSFSLTGLTNGESVEIRLISVDDDDRQSDPVSQSATPEDTTPPGAVVSLVGSAGDNELAVSWVNPSDTDLAQVEVLKNGEVVQTLDHDDPSRIRFTGLVNGQIQQIIVVAIDDDGLRSEQTVLSIASEDTVPPGVVENFSAVPGDRTVVLTWTNPTDADFAALKLYANDVLIENFATDQTGRTFTELVNGTSITYRLVAEDDDGLTSRPTIITATPRDTDNPDPVHNLRSQVGDNTASFSWTVPETEDLSHIAVYVDNQLHQTFLPEQIQALDLTGLTNDQPIRVSFQSIDDDNRTSALVEVRVTPHDDEVPSALQDLATFSTDNQVRFSWSEPEESDVVSILVRLNGEDYETLSSDAGTSYSLTSLRNNQLYQVELIVIDDDGLRSPAVLAQVSAEDTTPPSKPTDVVLTPGDQSLVLSWVMPTDADLDSVNIYIGETLYRTVAKRETPQVTLSNLTNGVSKTLRIQAVDNDGLESDVVERTASPEDTTAPSEPTQVAVVAGDNTLRLSWVHPTDTDVVGVKVFQSGELYRTVARSEPAQLLFVELVNGERQDFSLQSIDDDDLLSDLVAISAEAEDTEAPESPVGFEGVVGDRTLSVTWDAPLESDADRVEVYRDGLRIHTVSVGDTMALSLTNQENGTTQALSFVTIDDDGLRSDPATLSLTPEDSQAPDAVTDMAAESGDRQITLTWTAPTTSDLAETRLFINGEQSQTFGPSDTTTYSHDSIENNQSVLFELQTVDDDGLVSAKVAVRASAEDRVVPEAVTSLRVALQSSNQLAALWTASTAEDVVGYRVYVNGVLIETIEETQIQLPSLSSQAEHVIKVIAEDDDGLLSEEVTVSIERASFIPPVVQIGEMPAYLTPVSTETTFSWQIPNQPVPLQTIEFALVESSTDVPSTWEALTDVSQTSYRLDESQFTRSGQFVVAIRLTNKIGLVSDIAYSDSFVFDRTAPTDPLIVDNVAQLIPSNNPFVLEWGSKDPESGVEGVYFAVGTQSDGSDIRSEVSHSQWTFVEGSSALSLGESYFSDTVTSYVSIRVQNNAGLISNLSRTAAIKLDKEEPVISDIVLDDSNDEFGEDVSDEEVPVIHSAPVVQLDVDENEALRSVQLKLFKLSGVVDINAIRSGISSFSAPVDQQILVETYEVPEEALSAGQFEHVFDDGLENNEFYYVEITVEDQASNTVVQQTDIFRFLTVETLESFDDVIPYPNPFDPSEVSTSKVKFYNDFATADADLYIHSLSGEQVAHVSETNIEEGAFDLTWDGLDKWGNRVVNGPYIGYLLVRDQSSGEERKEIVKIAVVRR